MRYTIGARVVENDGKISDGIFAYGEYGLACILVSDDLGDRKYRIPVFTDLEEAKDFARHMCIIHRDEFHKRAQRRNFDISQFRFFVVKVDSSKFKRKLGEQDGITRESKYKSRKYYYVT